MDALIKINAYTYLIIGAILSGTGGKGACTLFDRPESIRSIGQIAGGGYTRTIPLRPNVSASSAETFAGFTDGKVEDRP